MAKPPGKNELRIVIFGPGFGESILIHVGDNKWICIDSYRERVSKKAFPIWYLESIGLDPKECVYQVVATHWHDDHINGLSEVVKTCTDAEFICSFCFQSGQFYAMISHFHTNEKIPGGSGAVEINEIFNYLAESDRVPTFVHESSVILSDERGSGFSHGMPVEGWTLSPSSKQAIKFFHDIGRLIPTEREPKRRCPAPKENHSSIAAFLRVGNGGLLLGADLEETGDNAEGWKRIVSLPIFQNKVASLFKIAHHGSRNGHNEDIWAKHLVEHPFAILTPYNRGRKLTRVCTQSSYCVRRGYVIPTA